MQHTGFLGFQLVRKVTTNRMCRDLHSFLDRSEGSCHEPLISFVRPVMRGIGLKEGNHTVRSSIGLEQRPAIDSALVARHKRPAFCSL